MGTRGLTCVVADGAYKIAQYNQYDAYPDGQGLTALDFCVEHLATPKGRRDFAEKLKRVRFVTEEETKRIETLPDNDPFVFYLNRNHGAKILDMVRTAGPRARSEADDKILLADSSAFAADSLFCEWAYVIDLDQKSFEVYKGFNEAPLDAGERFASLNPPRRAPGTTSSTSGTYYPVRLAAKFSLDDLPSARAFMMTFKQEAD